MVSLQDFTEALDATLRECMGVGAMPEVRQKLAPAMHKLWLALSSKFPTPYLSATLDEYRSACMPVLAKFDEIGQRSMGSGKIDLLTADFSRGLLERCVDLHYKSTTSGA